MKRPRLPRWLRKETWIADAPADDVSILDMLDGVRPAGEVPPMTDTQAQRLVRDVFNACPMCGFLPENGGHVLTHVPNGAHYVTYGESPKVHTVYDQDTPLASEVEAWLATQGGGAL